MKKIIFTFSMFLTLIIIGSVAYAQNYSKYSESKKDAAQSISNKGPDGKDSKISDVKYKANKSKDQINLKKVSELGGYVSDEELAKKDAKYTQKKLMTYQEYYDLGIDEALRHDIDPERMVWVFTSKFNKTHEINGVSVEKAVVTTVYDAETGDPISLVVQSDDPHGLDNLKIKK